MNGTGNTHCRSKKYLQDFGLEISGQEVIWGSQAQIDTIQLKRELKYRPYECPGYECVSDYTLRIEVYRGIPHPQRVNVKRVI